MGRKEVCALTKDVTRIAIFTDMAGRCYPKATGAVSKELQRAIDQYQGLIVKPTWLLSQLTKLIKD